MPDRAARGSRRALFLLWPFGVPILLVLNWWLFHAFNASYPVWYLKNGALISLAVGFLALTCKGLDAAKGLISANPTTYLAACFHVVGVFVYALRTHLRPPRDTSSRPRSGTEVQSANLWNNFVSAALTVPILALVLGWLAVVAPMNYVVTLISGAPARQALRNPLRRTIVLENGNQVEVLDTDANDPLPRNAVDVSFAREPLALTQALTAAVLWVTNWALNPSG